ncbi:8539_t:CDS:2, partial [Cetraspora pellucida]
MIDNAQEIAQTKLSLKEKTLKQIRDAVIEVDLINCGFVRAQCKSQWEPTQQPRFYSLIIDTHKALVIVFQEKILKTQKLLLKYARMETISGCQLAMVARKIQLLSRVFAYMKALLREFWSLLDEYDIWLNETFWVPLKVNLANKLTQVLDPSNWKLAQKVFLELE